MIDIEFVAQYLALRDGVRAGMGTRVSEIAAAVSALFKEYAAVLADLKSAKPHLKSGIEEARSHLNELIYSGFIEDTPLERLQHFPRYLKAVSMRVQKMVEDVNGDTLKMRQLSALQLSWLVACIGRVPLDDGGAACVAVRANP